MDFANVGSDPLAPLPALASVLSKLDALGIVLPLGTMRLDGYGDSVSLSQELLALIREGRKRAGTGLVWAMQAEKEPLPQVGDITVILDHRNEPSVITRTVQVSVVAFSEVTAEYALIEGEGDGSLEYWRQVHWAYFSRECARIGRKPATSMPVVCSVFEVLSVLA